SRTPVADGGDANGLRRNQLQKVRAEVEKGHHAVRWFQLLESSRGGAASRFGDGLSRRHDAKWQSQDRAEACVEGRSGSATERRLCHTGAMQAHQRVGWARAESRGRRKAGRGKEEGKGRELRFR